MGEKNNGVGAAEKEEFSLIPHATLMELYRGLLSCRALRNGSQAGTRAWAFDAAAVAMAKDLVAGDTVIADDAMHVMRVVHEIAAKGEIGQAKDSAGFAAELHRACGAALAGKTKKNGRVAVVFGIGADGPAWTDALEVARVHRLPMIFAAEEREAEARIKLQRARGAAELEPGTELPHIVVDGNDVVASYRVAHEAIDRARRDRGPTLIECVAFRVAGKPQQDSVAMMEDYLRGKGLL